MEQDISYYHIMNNNDLGSFIDFLIWFTHATDKYPNEEVNEDNLDIYFNSMIKSVDRFVRDARKAAVMKIKINAAWTMIRAGEWFDAGRILQQAEWVLTNPDQIPELRDS